MLYYFKLDEIFVILRGGYKFPCQFNFTNFVFLLDRLRFNIHKSSQIVTKVKYVVEFNCSMFTIENLLNFYSFFHSVAPYTLEFKYNTAHEVRWAVIIFFYSEQKFSVH